MMFDSHLMLDLMGNKPVTLELIRRCGFPVPLHLAFDVGSVRQAERFLTSNRGPFVVKPAAGSGGGNGVTTGIRTVRELQKASKIAARYDLNLLMEQQVAGRSHRLLYLDGILIHAVRRDPPILTGDGKQTLRALMREENRRRLSGTPITALCALGLDADTENTLTRQGLNASSVLPQGKSVIVKTACNQNNSEQNHDVTSLVHPKIRRMGSQLVRQLGVQLAGVDLITPDISVPLDEAGGVVGEINTTPGLHHHILTSTPPMGSGVAARILDFVFASGHGVMRLGHTELPTSRRKVRDAA
jgi:cyanophycin synthetase